MDNAASTRSSGSALTSPKMMLFILLIVYILNFLDRQIVAILAEPMKREFGLSDTQLGLLAGPAFAVFYAVLGVPIARYADRQKTDRVWLISVSLAVWSAMTAICGVAQNFLQLALARVGVGIGEAGCTPAAHSLIADTVPPEKRSSAIAFYGLGIPIGGLLGLIIGGIVNDIYGWRTAFMVVGAPGVLLAVILPKIILDPRRFPKNNKAASMEMPVAAALSVKEAAREIFTSRAYLYILIAASFTAFLSYGKGLWTISFFIRSHGFSTTEAGLSMAVALGLSGIIGTWLGGKMADMFGKRDKRHLLTLPAIGMTVAAPLLFASYWATDWRIGVALLIVPTILNTAYYGPAYGCVQGLVRREARAVAASLVVFGQNLIGLGLGPLAFGMLSDALQPMAGTDSVRWVLYGAAWLGLIPAFFFWRASLRLNDEMKSG